MSTTGGYTTMHTIFNELTDEWDEVVSIEYIGEEDTIDINVSGNRLFYANNILTHNSAVEEVEFDHSHIAGGISKINTADNVFGIFTSRQMRERGKYQIQCMKSRSSTGVGQKIDLDYDIENMRITDSGASSTDDTGYRTTASSMLEQIKTSTVVSSTPPNNITSESNKLKQMLGALRSSNI